LLLAYASSGIFSARPNGGPISHTVQPVAEPVPRLNRNGLADKDQEGCLKGTFGIMVVVQNAATDAPNHGTVAAQQGREGCFAAPVEERLQELSIRESCPILQQRNSEKFVENPLHRLGRYA
jgi:hypothetical protein